MRDVWGRALRACGYLLFAGAVGLAGLVLLPLSAVVVLMIAVGGVGLLLLPRWSELVAALADHERRRAARHLGEEVPELPARSSLEWRVMWRDPTVRRVHLWLPVHTVVSVVGGLVAVVLPGMLINTVQALLWWAFPVDMRPMPYEFTIDGWAVALWTVAGQLVVFGLVLLVLPTLARAHARLCLRLLAPSEAELLAARVDELRRTRADVVDTHGAELRRIERDLHDGTQARLVAIAMQLGVAKESVSDPQVAALLERAHEGTEEAMSELREVIRGVYPPILADRGLPGALTALAARTTVPVRLDVADPGELPVAVETAAYYVVTEAVANAVRHGGAENVSVHLSRGDGTLRVRVTDDGRGGVDETAGSGVRGLRRRVAALDGRVSVDSPVGGPTVIGAELPCGS
ncbi:sensor histidine kinase [Nocardiopsis sp. MG754419]|uniref:sensor histidine kinase n=1 Tax=Nocardiopsis sp. MG754419 TaxID=2259865 RepID=UPI001BA6FAE3|nr:sensor histidine kinase [Nocardiopsis sp. MG754419]MBR8740392.1 sensor histidine kinase [Nocardiopsis sp. MG754419]